MIVGSIIGGGVGAFSLMVNGGGVGGAGAVCLNKIRSALHSLDIIIRKSHVQQIFL